jgi:hypothetical protein
LRLEVTSFETNLLPQLNRITDDFGNLLFFDLETKAVDPQQSRHLLPEQGGISEICWLATDLIAVGTTRGKIIVYSSRNRAVSGRVNGFTTADLIDASQKRFVNICDVVAHGDGVSQIAVDSMAFASTTRCLVSVAEGKIAIKMWNIDDNGECLLPIWAT